MQNSGERHCRMVRRARGTVVALATLLAIAVPATANADDAADAGHGVVHADLEAAAAVCSGLVVDTAAQKQRLQAAGIDPMKPTAAFARGFKEADERASEAIANERLRSFCNDMLRSYGPQGSAVPGLVAPR